MTAAGCRRPMRSLPLHRMQRARLQQSTIFFRYERSASGAKAARKHRRGGKGDACHPGAFGRGTCRDKTRGARRENNREGKHRGTGGDEVSLSRNSSITPRPGKNSRRTSTRNSPGSTQFSKGSCLPIRRSRSGSRTTTASSSATARAKTPLDTIARLFGSDCARELVPVVCEMPLVKIERIHLPARPLAARATTGFSFRSTAAFVSTPYNHGSGKGGIRHAPSPRPVPGCVPLAWNRHPTRGCERHPTKKEVRLLKGKGDHRSSARGGTSWRSKTRTLFPMYGPKRHAIMSLKMSWYRLKSSCLPWPNRLLRTARERSLPVPKR